MNIYLFFYFLNKIIYGLFSTCLRPPSRLSQPRPENYSRQVEWKLISIIMLNNNNTILQLLIQIIDIKLPSCSGSRERKSLLFLDFSFIEEKITENQRRKKNEQSLPFKCTKQASEMSLNAKINTFKFPNPALKKACYEFNITLRFPKK